MTKETVIFKAREHYLPGDLDKGEIERTVSGEELFELAKRGAKWEHLEMYYLVSKTHLVEHFNLEYMQAWGELQIEISAAMVHLALKTQNPSVLKWLSQQWLGMSDSMKLVQPPAELSPKEVDAQLLEMTKKHKKKTGAA